MNRRNGESIRGVIPVLEVPFLDDEAIDYAGFESVINRTIGANADALMFPAFASEFLKLSAAEKAELETTLLAIGQSQNTPVVLSVAEHGTRLAAQAAESAAERGASAINLLPPHRLGVSPTAMRHHLETVLIAAAPTPVIVQYAPAETGATLDLGVIADLAETHENLWGLKVDASPAGAVIAALTRLSTTVGRPIGATVGYAGLHLLDGVARGATAVQPGCSFTEIYVALWRLLADGRTGDAFELHRRMLPYLAHWMQSVELIVAAEKRISYQRGWITTPVVRQPGYALDALELARIDAFLTEFHDHLGVRNQLAVRN